MNKCLNFHLEYIKKFVEVCTFTGYAAAILGTNDEKQGSDIGNLLNQHSLCVLPNCRLQSAIYIFKRIFLYNKGRFKCCLGY